jgi:phosphatidate cytidylyltransferase
VREIYKRVLAGLCLAPPIVAVFYFLPQVWFFIFLAIISVVAATELVRMTDIKGKYLILLLVLAAFVPLYRQSPYAFIIWLLFSPAIYLIAVSTRVKGETERVNADIMTGVNTLFLGQVCIVLPLFYFYLLKGLSGPFPLILLFAIWASDTGAYILGKNYGKRPLVPAISPKKTYEGLAGAILGSMIIILLSHKVLGIGTAEAVMLGGVIGVLGQVGDIFESIWKRVSKVKDSSSLIPGHGGILDRMDSFIFTAPLLYHYLAGMKI